MTSSRRAGATDDELVAWAQGGDRLAIEVLLRRHYDRLYAVCRGVVGLGDADDATQATMMGIVGGLARFDGRAKFTTWSHRVAVNAALDELRRRTRRPVPHDPRETSGDEKHPGQGELERARATSNETMLNHGRTQGADPDGGDPAQAVADRALVEAALAALPDEFRIPLVLAEYGGLEYTEIAEVIGVPGGTVRSRIARARRRIAVDPGSNHQKQPAAKDRERS